MSYIFENPRAQLSLWLVRIIIFGTCLFLLTSTVQAEENPFPEEGSTTRAIEVCEPVQVRHFRNSSRVIQLERCTYGHGGVSFDEASAVPIYYQNGEVFTGSVRETDGQFRFSDSQELAQQAVTSAPSDASTNLPNTFKCDGANGNELQCLICNCFYETRGQNYQEQVLVARVVTSRVMNPRFSNTVCGVVHERNSTTNTAQFSWIRLSEDNCMSSDCSSDNLNYKINSSLGVGANYNNSLERDGFNSCHRASLEALEKRGEYFASYYLNKSAVDTTPSWVSACEERFPPARTVNRIANNALAHTFYRICEDNERSLAPHLLRPVARPPLRDAAPPSLRPRARPDRVVE